ncbi:MAG TPA: hypothetical protein VN181_10905, partial [Thermoanaerobaculia bacterium]|nr:hypothetical protein [Thermoanaerobaculia bacterium]
MRKALTSNNLQRDISKALAAVSLMAVLAVFGCSTNRNPGNGEPYTGGPSWGPTTPSSTSTPGGGSSSGTSGVPPSMTSSSTLSTNDAALAILAEHQLQPRILGPAAPDGGTGIVSSQPTGQWVNPALVTNPQVTVNSSASSYPTPVVTSGAGEGVAGTATDSAAIFSASAPNFVTTATSVGNTGTVTAPVIASGANTLTPATASSAPVPGAFAAGPGVATNATTPVTTG